MKPGRVHWGGVIGVSGGLHGVNVPGKNLQLTGGIGL